MRILLTLILLASLISACTPAGPTTPAPETSLPLSPCELHIPGTNLSEEAQCGSLQVYEDRQAQSGRTIDLQIAVIPAVSRSPAPDPVFILVGGPGEAATLSFLAVETAFEKINATRDIVLVDQRGTGGSHPLNCLAALDDQPGAADDMTEADFPAFLQTCLETLDADPLLYTTTIAMQDLEQVRVALGYDQINLYGVSYGSRAALVYVRMYPDNVRSVILDGVDPPSWSLGENSSEFAQRTLDLIFKRCTSEPDCAQAFPDLPNKFETILSRLEAAPVEVSLPDPTTGEAITITVDREMFTSTIFNLSYSTEMVSLIPLLIQTTYEQQDYNMAAAQWLNLTSNLTQFMSDGMRYSVLCAEDVPFVEAGEQGSGYIRNVFGEAFGPICEVWPHEVVSPEFKEPFSASVPALILSGEMDPVTPPENGVIAVKMLPNSLHIEVPGQGHVNIGRGCLPTLAAQFLAEGSPSQLDTSCVGEIEPMPFFTSFSGPQP